MWFNDEKWVFKKLSKFCKSPMLKLVVYFATFKKNTATTITTHILFYSAYLPLMNDVRINQLNQINNNVNYTKNLNTKI